MDSFDPTDLQSGGKGLLSNDLGKAKICQLHRKVLVGEKDVLWFDVAVDNVALVLYKSDISISGCGREGAYQVSDALKQLDEYHPRFILGQLLLHDNAVEQFSFGGELKNQIDPVVFIKRISQAQHVRMADRLENTNFLLQTISLRLGALTMTLFESFDSILHASAFFHAEVDSRKVPLAELLKDSILLAEGVALSALRIVEHEASLIQDRNLVPIFELAPFVPTNDCLIDESAITGEILNNSDRFAVLVLVEYEAMSVRDGC